MQGVACNRLVGVGKTRIGKTCIPRERAKHVGVAARLSHRRDGRMVDLQIVKDSSLNVLALLYDDGVLRQLRTTASGLNPATDVPPGSFYRTIDTSALRWQLVFDFIDPIVAEARIFATTAAAAAAADYDGPQLSYRWPGCPGLSGNNQDCAGANSPDFAPSLVVAVPEPDNLALAAVALTALWGLGRRRGIQRLTATA